MASALSASSLGRNIPVLSKSRAILIVKTDVLSIHFLIEENNLFLKMNDRNFTVDFSVKLVGLGFFEGTVWLQHTERGFTVWWHFFFLNHHIVDLGKRVRKPNERVLMLSRHFRIENSEPWTIPD